MSNVITTGIDISELLLKSIYDPANRQSINAFNFHKYGFKFVASDTIQGANDAPESTGTVVGFQKRNTLKLNYYMPGTIRISFDMWVGGSSGDGHGRIYKNGAVFGTQRTTNSTTSVTFTEDFNMVNFTKGDRIELWIRANVLGVIVYVRNFRIYHDIIIVPMEIYTPV